MTFTHMKAESALISEHCKVLYNSPDDLWRCTWWCCKLSGNTARDTNAYSIAVSKTKKSLCWYPWGHIYPDLWCGYHVICHCCTCNKLILEKIFITWPSKTWSTVIGCFIWSLLLCIAIIQPIKAPKSDPLTNEINFYTTKFRKKFIFCQQIIPFSLHIKQFKIPCNLFASQ